MSELGERSAAESTERDFWGRHGVRLAWIATVLLVLPALRAHFSLDDFLQRVVLEGKFPELGFGPATLYDFTGGDRSTARLLERGALPWLTDPRLEIRFFRPLSSLSIALDQTLFGRAELPSHLVGAALFVAFTALAFAFFRRVLGPNRAGLAAFLFALSGGHAVNLTWVAGRHVLIGAVLGTLAVLAHVTNAERGAARRLPRWLAPAALIVAMFASETSLAALAALQSYELFASGADVRSRLRRAAPWLGLGVLYLVVYDAAGYGVKHSGLYVSPLASPLGFLAAALTRLPMLLGELAVSVPASLWGLSAALRPGLAVFGALGCALVLLLALRGAASGAERRKIAWLGSAALLGTLTAVGGVPDGRTLLIPLLAAAPLVATAIDSAWRAPGRAWALRSAAVLLLFLHVALALLARVGMTELMVAVAGKQRDLAESADFSRCEAGAPAFLITAADPALSLAGATSLAYYRPDLAARHPHLDVLSLAPHDQRVERTGENGIVLHVDGRPRRSTIFEELFRDAGLVPGQTFELGRFSARVEATERGVPTRVAFELPPNACLVTLSEQRLRGEPLPDVGTTRKVSHEPGPMGL
jgi:hypothetical protein